MLDMSLETVCWLIVRVREFEVEDSLPTEPPDDDATLSPDTVSPEDEVEAGTAPQAREDPVYAEARRVIEALNDDAQVELTALAWLGRGDYQGLTEWQDAVREARDRHVRETAPDYLLGMPLLADYLEAGLEQLGLTCEGTEAFSV